MLTGLAQREMQSAMLKGDARASKEFTGGALKIKLIFFSIFINFYSPYHKH